MQSFIRNRVRWGRDPQTAMTRIFCLAILLAVCLGQAIAQNTFSPYTSYGLGDFHDKNLAHSAAMGGVGIGLPAVWHINTLNPALLTSNSLSVFELGFQGERRTLSTDTESQTVGAGGYRYINFAFPIITGKWTSSVSMSPFSSVNYSFQAIRPIENAAEDGFSAARIVFEGEGGLSEVRMMHGVRLAKGLSVGARGSYIFGFTQHESTSLILDRDTTGAYYSISGQFPTNLLEKTDYKGVTYGFGLSYGRPIGNSNHAVGFGMTYDVGTDLSGSRNVLLTAQSQASAGDTLSNRSIDGSFQLPSKFGIGISWIKNNFMSVGIDYVQSNWNSDAGFENDAEQFKSTFALGLGVEIIPRFDDVDDYFKRIRYRFGARYEQLPYVLSGETIDDFGITFGWSLPVRGVSALNMAFKAGSRGKVQEGLVQERYFKFMLAATVNDRWFVRRKYN